MQYDNLFYFGPLFNNGVQTTLTNYTKIKLPKQNQIFQLLQGMRTVMDNFILV